MKKKRSGKRGKAVHAFLERLLYKKKTKWTVISGKKSVSLSKKKKDSVMVKAKKTGKAKVQAKVGRKKYIATVMVFEKKQEN